eukprot:TRINITY_DN22217_c0_g1_i1.p1 TRINITY_DN22217_c0_g1~~TRINITY_DN22217_c0_g1_i1.p1  ORF type:complete len:536 (+),score=99.89 TRINITY_DN22217_c0_g1_i1:49-1608(+)
MSRFWWRKIFTTNADTATDRLYRLTFETGLLFASLSTTGAVMWHLYGVRKENVIDGLARNTLHRRWGEDLYLSEKILYKSPSHRVYSCLDIRTGDCFVYAVHFPSGGVWSTLLKSDNSLETEKIYMPNGGIKATDYELTERPFYTKKNGVLGAMKAWMDATKYMHASAMEECKPFRELELSASMRAQGGALYARTMFPWVMYSAWWGVKFPLEYCFNVEKDPDAKPVVNPENPSIQQWRKALMKATNGLPITSSNGDIDITENGFSVTLNNATLKLAPDVNAAHKLMDGNQFFSRFIAMAVFGATFLTFTKHWRHLAVQPHDILYKNLTENPRELALRFAANTNLRLAPLKFACTFFLVGHTFYERSEEPLIVMGKYLSFSVLWDAAAAFIIVKYSINRAIPTALTLHGSIKGSSASLSKPSFFKTSRPAGNITMNDAIEFDLVTPPSEREKMREHEVAEYRQNKWQEMLSRHDLELVARNEELRKLQVANEKEKEEKEKTLDKNDKTTGHLPPKAGSA